MQKTVNSVLHNPATRALILVVLVIPISAYLGTSPVRRGFLYYARAMDLELEMVLGRALRMQRADHAHSGARVAAAVIYRTDLLRASRAACAFFVACEMLPILAGGTRVRRR